MLSSPRPSADPNPKNPGHPGSQEDAIDRLDGGAMDRDQANHQPPAPGKTIGRYRFDEKIGAGAMGEIFRAWDTALRRWVAVKRLHGTVTSDRKRRERILREGRAASPLKHPAIVTIHDVFEHGGEVYLVQELVHGGTLREKLGEPLNLPAFYRIAEGCAGALVEAADRGIAHCDLKPENILLDSEGFPHILDFGVACHYLTAEETAMVRDGAGRVAPADAATRALQPTDQGLGGTPAYLSPELAQGRKPDTRTDIFSLGIVFYEMLTGRNPFEKKNLAETLAAVLRDSPPPPSRVNPGVTPELDRLVMRMIEKDRDQRLPTASDLQEEIQTLRRAASDRRGRRLRPALVALLILVPIAAGLWLTRDRGGPISPRPATGAPHIIVEDFEGLGTASDNEVFASGVTEAVQTRLAGLQGILVMDARADCGGHLALEGSVQQEGDHLRIAYRVVDHALGTILAGDIVQGNRRDIFDLQDQVAEGVALALAGAFDISLILPPRQTPTPDVVAYGSYVQARGYLRRPGGEAEAEIAAGLFERALERDPSFTLALAGLGEAYWRLYEETMDTLWVARAENAARRASEQDSDRAEVHAGLGTIYRGTGKLDLAISEFRRALEIDPRNREAYLGLALAQRDRGDLQAAEETLKDAIRRSPEDWEGHHELGLVYHAGGDLERALQCFRAVVELTPDNARGYSDLGAIYQLLGRTDAAIESYEHALALKPIHSAYSNLATLHRSEGRLEQAIEVYSAALRQNDGDYRVWGSLGATYDLLPGMEAVADSAYRQAAELADAQVRVNPHNPRLLVLLAQYRALSGEPETARRLLERLEQTHPEWADVLFYLSGTYEILGEREKALLAARKAMQAGYPPDTWRGEPSLEALVADPEFVRISREFEPSD